MDQKYGSEIWIKNMDQNMAELKKHLWATKNHLPHSNVWIKSNMETWIKYGSKYGSTEKAEQQQWATKNHLPHSKGPKRDLTQICFPTQPAGPTPTLVMQLHLGVCYAKF